MATANTHSDDSSALSDLLKALGDLTVDKYSDRFRMLQTTYRFTGDEALRVDVLVPYELESRQCAVPVLVRIHGGFLITGSSLYPPWFNTWILDYAVRHGAVIISPDYRLLPEANGHDILSDMSEFWSWLHSGKVDDLMDEHCQTGLRLDFNRLLLVGESAGGYLATQLALTYHNDVRALIALYPMLDLKSPFYTTCYSKPIMRVPNRPNSIIDEHVRTLKACQSHCESPERLILAFSIVQNGRFLEFFDGGKSEVATTNLFPLERLDDRYDADGESGGLNLPEMFIFHGEQDSAVPIESSHAFVGKMKAQRPSAKVTFYSQDGDHGFDTFATLETPWLSKGLKSITKAWLGSVSE